MESLREVERQLVLLALAVCAVDRSHMDQQLYRLAGKFDAAGHLSGQALYLRFKQSAEQELQQELQQALRGGSTLTLRGIIEQLQRIAAAQVTIGDTNGG